MDKVRNGNFTSSEIVALTTNGRAKDSLGDPFYTYIRTRNMERRLGRALVEEINARPVQWGSLLEPRVNDLLGLEYTYCSNVTLPHPTIDCWYGSPDALKEANGILTVADIKCPFTMQSFCEMVDGWQENGVQGLRDANKYSEKYYWQLVSNSIITESASAELIIYCPYKSELAEIREMASSAGEVDGDYKWVYWAKDEELPYLIDGGHYKNLYVLNFDVPKADKDFLTKRVQLASKDLIERKLIPA